MTESFDDLLDPLDAVVEDFLGRRRFGESPSADEYARRHPELADRIRVLFPTLVLLEGGSPALDSTSPAPLDFAFTGSGEAPAALGPFRIVREIGRGGMGVVYEAVQEPLGRHVALKILPPECGRQPSFRERFSREAAAAARLHHTNIVPVFASGEHGGILYFAMQFIDGRTVAELLAEQRAGLRRPADRCRWAARLAMQAAEALACAHDHGILHRDVKPANFLVDTAGTLWVADFGLAKAGDAEELTETGELVGTLRFLAPERFAGHCDARSDVYALGATLYEMLALRAAFDESDRLRLVQQVAGGATPLRQAVAGVPPDLETVVHKAMAADPADRYPTAQAMADDLRRFLADLPVAARRTPARERLRRWARHNPALARMTAAVAGLLLLVALGASLFSLELMGALRRTRQAEHETQRKLMDSLVAQARAVHRGGRSGQRFESLKLLDQAAELARGLGVLTERRAELRDVTIAALAMPDLYPGRTWPGFPPGTSNVDFDERLEIYARTDNRGGCSVRRVDGDIEIANLPRPESAEGPTYPRFSPDGRFLAVEHLNGITRIWQIDEAGATPVLDQDNVYHTEFHPTQPQVAFSLRDGHINLWELPSGRRLASLEPDRVVGEPFIALHPTEPLLAVASYQSRVVQIRDLPGGAVLKTMELTVNGYHLAWHPAGHTLAASDGDGRAIHLFDRATFRRLLTFDVHGGGPRMCYNRAGDRMVVSDWAGSVALYEAATGKLLFQPAPTPIILLLRFREDGRRLAGFVDGRRLGLWDVGEGREYRTLRWVAQRGPDLHAAVSPDGRLLVVATLDGVGFRDLETGADLDFLPLERPARLVDFEPGARGALLLGDESGLYRWPVRPDPRVPGRIRIGPPEALGFPAGYGYGRSADGRVLATCFPAVDWFQPWAGGWIRHADRPDQPVHFAPGTDIRELAVSPDGRWVVAVDRNVGRVRLWDAQTGRSERTLRENGIEPHFSPDGRWLAVGGSEGCLLAVGSWEEVRKLDGWGHFSPDGRMLAVRTDSATALRLDETETGRVLARLATPELSQLWKGVFTPDGSRLLACSTGVVHLWDLRRIRAELSRRDLDWEAPPYPPAPEPSSSDRLTLELDQGDFRRLHDQRLAENFDRAVRADDSNAIRWFLRGKFHQEAGRYAEALRDMRAGIDRRKDHPRMLNDLARLDALAPEPLRDVPAAVSLAERAVRLQPGNWSFANTLGIAYYRAGRYADARATLEKSLAGAAGEADAANLYFLAMCHHRLGDAARARDCLLRAKAWHERQAGGLPKEDAEELRGFGAEAEAVVRLNPAVPVAREAIPPGGAPISVPPTR